MKEDRAFLFIALANLKEIFLNCSKYWAVAVFLLFHIIAFGAMIGCIVYMIREILEAI